MDATQIVLGIYGVIAVGVIVALVVLAIRKNRVQKRENFEKRDN